ncbi:MAG: carboxypeptidase regulatory-like domain-containing protein [Acidobacteriaceae bacterium]
MTTSDIKKHRAGQYLWIPLLLAAATCMAFGQAGNGSISGIVSDSSGATIVGATVTVQSDVTGVALTRVTNTTGVYSIASLPPATYAVTFSQKGFATSVHRNVIVTVDQNTILNATLSVGSVNQVVTVAGTSSPIETANSTVGQLIDESTINRVPLLTRDVYQLVQLSAGVIPTNGIPNASDTTAVFNARPGADVAGYTINGATPGSVQFLVDGSPIGIGENNLGAEIPAMQIPLDDVQEYRVETQNTPANYQSGGAGAISLVTKSGTNHFHGDAFVYIRPNTLSANDYFEKQIEATNGTPNQAPDFHRYQEGGSIGAPLLHDKLFLFADYEATQQDSLQTAFYTVPTAAERNGDFSADSFTIYNPLVPDLPNGQRQAFSGNKIPQGDLNQIALNYGPQLPAPNAVGIGPYHLNNYSGSGLDPNDAQKFDIRLDGYRGQKQHIYGRFSFARLLLANADLYGSSDIYDPYYYHIVTNARNFLLADDFTLTQNTLLQFRYSFTRHYENQTGDPRQVGFDMTKLGFPSSLAAQQVYKDIPMVSFATTAGMGSNPWTTFQYVSENPYDFIAALSTNKGKHVLSAGVELEKQFMNEGQPIAPSGWYQFDNTATSSTTFAGDGSDYASFLIGMGSAPGYEYDNFTHDIFGAEANPYYAAYAQDAWQVTKHLTVDLGLRWDIFGGRTERHNRLEYFDPSVQYSANGVPLTGGEEFAGVDGHSRSPFTTNMKNFGPRVSFAWQAAKDLVLRGGSGIYYGPSSQMVANSALNSDGFFAATFWSSTAYNADGNTTLVAPLGNAFPNGVTQPTGSSLGPQTNLGNELATELHSQRTPTTYDFNLGTESQLPHGVVLALAYVGSRGRFLPLAGVDLNQLPLSVIGQYQSGLMNNSIPNKWEGAYPVGTPFYGQSTVPEFLGLEAYPQFTCGAINCGVEAYGYPAGSSNYDSLQVKLEKRLTSHFTTLATFTWGKLMTDDFGPPLSIVGYSGGSAQDWRDMNLEHSLSAQDVADQFNLQASYDLPLGSGRYINLHGWQNQAFGGWTVNGITYLSTGVPVEAPAGTGDPYFNQRVNQVCNPGSRAPHTATQWFNWTCFAEPASQFVAGTSSRMLSDVRTNGAHDLDLSLYKNFRLGEGRNLRLEVSSYNLTNSVQFGYPSVFWNPSPNSANMSGFGQITSDVNMPRQFQFAARYMF